MSFHAPEQYRQKKAGAWSSDETFGNNGAFLIPPYLARKRPALRIMVSDGLGWEHVSVSTASRCPTWEEMCFVKDLFWDEEDCVMQLHPPRSEWVNNHPYCLHLWRPTEQEIPRPMNEMVGIREAG
jgi:hypothetical protein